jgi:hypothetical protein
LGASVKTMGMPLKSFLLAWDKLANQALPVVHLDLRWLVLLRPESDIAEVESRFGVRKIHSPIIACARFVDRERCNYLRLATFTPPQNANSVPVMDKY